MSLLFKHCFFDPIRRGRKTQTIRLWRRPMVRAGRDVAVPFLPGGRLHIEAVEPIAELADLTESDAQADGFASLADLLAEVRGIYPELARRNGNRAGSRQLFRVRFRFLPDPS